MHLAIGICSNREQSPDFTSALINLMAGLQKAPPLFQSVGLKLKKQCSLLPQGRQEILDECLADDFTHLLFLDDDMVFPSDLVHRLMASGKRCIGVNSLRKDPARLTYTARDLNDVWLKSKGKTGVEEVSVVGLAMFLLDLDAVRKIPKPHFEIRWNEELKTYKGEDFYFLHKLKSAGEKIYIDHELSNRCGHIGSFIYSYQMYG